MHVLKLLCCLGSLAIPRSPVLYAFRIYVSVPTTRCQQSIALIMDDHAHVLLLKIEYWGQWYNNPSPFSCRRVLAGILALLQPCHDALETWLKHPSKRVLMAVLQTLYFHRGYMILGFAGAQVLNKVWLGPVPIFSISLGQTQCQQRITHRCEIWKLAVHFCVLILLVMCSVLTQYTTSSTTMSRWKMCCCTWWPAYHEEEAFRFNHRADIQICNSLVPLGWFFRRFVCLKGYGIFICTGAVLS